MTASNNTRRGTGVSLTLLCLIPLADLRTAEGQVPAVQSPEQQFDVFEYRVLGNTRLAQIEVERAVYPFLGPAQDLQTVERARGELEQAYRRAGFGTVYVDIPEQSVQDGVVRLNVTEGKLARVSVSGARYFSGRQIRAALPAAAVGEAPHLPSLQTELAAVNTLSTDRQITPVLAPGPMPGTVDLKLMVEDKLPFHGSIELNDRYTADTSRLRATIALGYDNMFNRLDSLGLQYQTAPEEPGEVGVFAASYTTRLDSRGNSLSLLFVNSDSNVSTLGTLGVLGKGQIYALRFQFPLSNTYDQSHGLTAGLEYKDFRERIKLDENEDFKTPVSYFNASLGYAGSWRMQNSRLSLAANANFGPRPGANGEKEFADKRFRARPNYFYLRADGAGAFAMPLGTTLRLKFSGQYAPDPLIANEQFAIGGVDGARGYLEAEDLGDRGLRGSTELAAPALRLFAGGVNVEGYAFFDAASVWTIYPLPGEDRQSILRSWGAGIDLTAFGHFSGSLTFAEPLVDSAHTPAGQSRLHFSLRSTW